MRNLALFVGLVVALAMPTAIAADLTVTPETPQEPDVYCNPLTDPTNCTLRQLNCIVQQLVFNQVCIA